MKAQDPVSQWLEFKSRRCRLKVDVFVAKDREGHEGLVRGRMGGGR